jgi:hypothetical protein
VGIEAGDGSAEISTSGISCDRCEQYARSRAAAEQTTSRMKTPATSRPVEMWAIIDAAD